MARPRACKQPARDPRRWTLSRRRQVSWLTGQRVGLAFPAVRTASDTLVTAARRLQLRGQRRPWTRFLKGGPHRLPVLAPPCLRRRRTSTRALFQFPGRRSIQHIKKSLYAECDEARGSSRVPNPVHSAAFHRCWAGIPGWSYAGFIERRPMKKRTRELRSIAAIPEGSRFGDSDHRISADRLTTHRQAY